jgi:predicted DNA-binding transcriptional regulator YafY
MRASRLVSILLLLQTRGRLTAQELADALEVSVRTVYRDMESLAAAGVPLYGEAGHDGGYRLVDGYRTRLTGLTAGEADSLFLTGMPSAAADLGLGASVTAAQLKLMAALPAELRDRAGRVAERFHLDAPSWYRDADSSPHLVAVAEAVWNERAIRIHYLRWAKPQEVTRVVQPYGLVLKAGRWYLVAAAGNTTRTYRVSRIVDVQPLDVTFERDLRFDLASYWQQYLRNFDERRHVDHAVVRLSPDALARLPEVAEPSVVDAARCSAEPDEQGWLRVTIPVEEPSQALSELFRLAPDIEVLSPGHLRAQMIETLQSLNRLYATRTRPGRRASVPADPAPPKGSPE